MILPRKEDAIHKSQLYRLLISLVSDPYISQRIYFKGGTCAALLGYLDRFSVDLDFDLKEESFKDKLRERLHHLFSKLGLEIEDESQKALQFFLKYQARKGLRNTIKLEILDGSIPINVYQAQYLKDIDRMVMCQTIETMFAHKLVAVMDRYERNNSLAGRDIYDIHYFFNQGYDYNHKVIEARRNQTVIAYLTDLKQFIAAKINEKIITQDLNTLLPYEKFKALRKTLKQEVLVLLEDEILRLNHEDSASQ